MNVPDTGAPRPSVLLRQYLSVFFIVWQIVALGCPQRPLRFIEFEDTPDPFRVYVYGVHEDRNFAWADFMPPDWTLFWTQLIMKNACDIFCVLTLGVVRQQLRGESHQGIGATWKLNRTSSSRSRNQSALAPMLCAAVLVPFRSRGHSL
jgi:hypothetical protein